MIRIKIDATESTNDHLKKLMRQGRVEDGTVIRTLNQTNGRGQRGAKWHFDKGKSLAISVLKKWRRDPQSDLFHLQCVISLAIFESLRALGQAQWHIKWPNDIMADGLKICGILIEHHYQGSLYATVVGLGVNVNNDPIKGLPKAGSIAGVLGKKLDLDALDISLSDAIFKAMDQFNPKTVQADLTAYNAKLYLKNSERQFAGSDGRVFNGIIQRVDAQGRLVILIDGMEHQFQVGSIKYL